MRRRALLSIKKGGGASEYEPYLTFVCIQNSTFKLSRNNCYYRIDGGSWTYLSADSSTTQAKKGQIIQFKAENPSITGGYGIGTFTISGGCNVRGNIMSMLYGDNVEGATLLNYAFQRLFYGSLGIFDASMLYLPVTTLKANCYTSMFENCTNLTAAPILPATGLANYAYSNMFKGCTSLKVAPELPTKTLSTRCYYQMFYGCSNLEIAPVLPALTIPAYAYYRMFYGCSKIQYIKAMMTTEPSSTTTAEWVSGVSSTGTFVKNRNATWNVTGDTGIPSGWTIEYADA